ncbi:MAG: right-handed parallel beta-helix repeat-containing protein, partial [Chloroflexota bacterium]|nr:right-handed parallel beta-helix repeat-containing protein [Chloroflexota bacterium]
MGKKLSLAVVLLIVLSSVLGASGSVAAQEAEGQHLAIPSYFYPGPLWDQMAQAHHIVQVAIINPNSGPGAVSNPAYVAQVQRSQATGLTILGYVHTSYGARADTDIKAEIDAYANWYHVDGIFFDEASTDCARQSYYAALTAYARQRTSSHRAVRTALNPGTQTNECYMAVADVIVTFEGDASAYQSGYSAPSWVANYAPGRFWHLVYNVPTAQQMRAIVLLSKERRAGWIYVTPDNLPNPWDTLPTGSYWSSELAAATPNGEGGERRADVRAFGATGDGTTDDTAAFTQALASLSEGGILVVPPGTYRVQPGALTIPSKTAMLGERATIKPFGTGFDLIAMQGTDVGMTGMTIDGENHVVRGVTIVAGSENVLLAHDTLQNFTQPTAADAPQTPAAIRIDGDSTRIAIDSVTVANVNAVYSNAVTGGNPSYVARGIWISAYSQSTTSKEISIRGSHFSGVGPKDDGDCIVIQDSKDASLASLTIEGNTFDGCAKRAIKIQVPGVTVTNNRIVNPFDGNNPLKTNPAGLPQDMFSAISAYASHVTISDNTISGVGAFYIGIDVSGSCAPTLDAIAIRGNQVSMGPKALQQDTSLIRSSGPVTNYTIAGNTLANAQHGIVVPTGVPQPTMERNHFTNVTTT